MDDDLYRENLMDHYRHPRHHGALEGADAEAEGQNPLCGDQVTVMVRLEDGRIGEMRFTGHGCAVSQAATSMLTELVQGMPVEEAAALPSQAILDELSARGRDGLADRVDTRLTGSGRSLQQNGQPVTDAAVRKELVTKACDAFLATSLPQLAALGIVSRA